MDTTTSERSRRTFMKASALTGALGLGLTGAAVGQQTPTDGGGSQSSLMFTDEFRAGALFRVASPALQEPPSVDGSLEGYTTRVVEYFNTSEEVYLFLPQDTQVEQGELYALADTAAANEGPGVDLVGVEYSQVNQDDITFDIVEDDGFEILDDEGGGEGAVRPSNFHAGSLFRITSGPQGWVPEDVADSGVFTDYTTHHAEYLGTDDEFLFFPQEDAEVEVDQLYVIRDEFEFFTPDGNLVATEFDRVDEESLSVDDEFL